LPVTPEKPFVGANDAPPGCRPTRHYENLPAGRGPHQLRLYAAHFPVLNIC